MVVMVIAVLVVIALPSFLGFRRASQDRAAQASLVTAEKVARLVAMEQGSIPNQAGLLATFPAMEPALDWVDHLVNSTGPSEVSMDQTGGGRELALSAMSQSGSCFYLRVDLDAPTSKTAVASAATCNSHDYQTGADTGW